MIIKGFPYRFECFADSDFVNFPEDGFVAVGQQQVDDAGSHDTTAQHSDFGDFGRFQALGPRKPARGASVEKDADQVLGHIGQDAVGKKLGPVSKDYTWKDVVLYALGDGAGFTDLDYC